MGPKYFKHSSPYGLLFFFASRSFYSCHFFFFFICLKSAFACCGLLNILIILLRSTDSDKFYFPDQREGKHDLTPVPQK